MAGASTGKIDVLRKSLIIACLVAGMVVLHHFNTTAHEFDPTGMLALGFVILASYTVGELVGVIKLPHITGYLFAGLFLGPSMAYMIPREIALPPFDRGVLNTQVIQQLEIFNTLALALSLSSGPGISFESPRATFKRTGPMIS